MSTPDKDHPYRGYFCRFPFEHAAITATGEVYQCCAAFLPKPAGNLLHQSFEEVWNSEEAQAIRKTIHDGSFTYCQDAKCPYLQGTVSLPKKEDLHDPEYAAIIAEGQTKLDRGPRELHLAYDTTCNLACSFCRNDFIALRGEELSASQRIQERVFREAAQDATRIMISAQGDPFASKVYSAALAGFETRRFPKARIKITSNGLLFTPENWKRIQASHRAIDWIHISLNAARPETFRLNQKGGDWAKVYPNLQFIATLRRKPWFYSYRLTHLLGRRTRFITFSFIIQQNNYREMPAFVDLGEELDIDQVMFTSIFHADRTYSDREYAKLPVHLPNHPEHQEFLRIMCHPRLQAPIAFFADNVAAFLPRERIARETVRGALPWTTGAAHEWEAWYAALDADAHKGKSTPMRLEFDVVREGGAIEEKYPFEQVVERLRLEDEQVLLCRKLLDELKNDFVSLFDRAPVGGGPSPCAQVATLLAENPGDKDAVNAAFLAYATAHQDPESGGPFTEALGRLEMERRGEFYRLLRPGQRKRFSKLPVDSLLSIDTGHDPFGAAVGAHTQRQQHPGAEAPSSKDGWKALMSAAGVDAPTGAALRKRIDAHKQAVCSVFSTCPAQGPAPIAVLAEHLARGASDGPARFLEYAGRTMHPQQKVSYLIAVHQLDEACREEVRAMVAADQWRLLVAHAPESMGDWPTGADPFGEAVSQQVAEYRAATVGKG